MIVLSHFLISAVVALIIFLGFARLGGQGSIAGLLGVVIVAIACATLAHFLSPWATPATLAVYFFASLQEYRSDRAQAASWKARQQGRSEEP